MIKPKWLTSPKIRTKKDMMNKFHVKLAALLGIGLFLMACNFIFSGSSGNSPSEVIAPDSTQVPESGDGQSPVLGGAVPDDSPVPAKSGDYVPLPLRPEVPPSDVIQQISMKAVGGGGATAEGPCARYCIYLTQNTIALAYFAPNQTLTMDIYSPYNYPSYEFLTEITVQTDGNGALELHIDRDPQFFFIIVSDQNGNALTNDEAVRLNQFDPPSCSGEFESRFAVGMQVRTISVNGVPAQLRWEPSANNPDSVLMDFAEGSETKIMIGPKCNEGMTWWMVLSGTTSGWVAESNLELVK